MCFIGRSAVVARYNFVIRACAFNQERDFVLIPHYAEFKYKAQQAITSKLSDIYKPKFSNSSYGFKPNRSAHRIFAAASRYIRDGHGYVVDIDLAKYFDTVNHDRLMYRLSQDIDKQALKLIRYNEGINSTDMHDCQPM